MRLVWALLVAVVGTGCGRIEGDLSSRPNDSNGGNAGSTSTGPASDPAGTGGVSGGGAPGTVPDAMVGGAGGRSDQSMTLVTLGPPFPLLADATPGEQDHDVGRSGTALVLARTNYDFGAIWIAVTRDWNVGTVAKISTKDLKEIARYPIGDLFFQCKGQQERV